MRVAHRLVPVAIRESEIAQGRGRDSVQALPVKVRGDPTSAPVLGNAPKEIAPILKETLDAVATPSNRFEACNAMPLHTSSVTFLDRPIRKIAK